MAFTKTELIDHRMYYVWGNTPPVCLTQDLPPEQDADILLLGCGDARHVLFTCYADSARKIDVTCCDIEPGIHARNVLLYTLLMEDNLSLNIERFWNIYYHWKIDKASLELLETQTEKLLKVSETIDEWHGSIFGAHIRFCDAQSLALVRSYWMGFTSRSLSPSEKKCRLSQLQTAIDRARNLRIDTFYGHVSPESIFVIQDALGELTEQWWNNGIMLPARHCVSKVAADTTNPTETPEFPNPMILYSPNASLVLSSSLIPLSGFSLSTSLIPIAKESVFHQKTHAPDSLSKSLVAGAQTHFTQWALAFQRAARSKLVIRIFSGDALAFCLTLRHHQQSIPVGARSMNLFHDCRSNSRLELHQSEYGHDENAAPVTFDIIDTSNIADCVGALNVIATASSLLKYNAACSLYIETLGPLSSNLSDRLSSIFSVDVRTVSLLLGLVLPDLFTNATNKAEDELFIEYSRQVQGGLIRGSRLRWKRLQGCKSSDTAFVQIEAKALANLLAQMHDIMFMLTTRASKLLMQLCSNVYFHDGSAMYNQASFALFLYNLQATVTTDWAQCIRCFYENRLSLDSFAPFAQDLSLNVHLCGMDEGTFRKPTRDDVCDAILASILPVREKVPDQLCVTIRIRREKLTVFSRGPFGTPALMCKFEGGDTGKDSWSHTFSSVQIAFGKWHEQTNEDLYPFIEEDSRGLTGTLDMLVSLMVPTWMLLSSKRSIPVVMCELTNTESIEDKLLEDLGPDLCLARCEMTHKDVFVTQYMPGMPGLPKFARENKPSTAGTIVRLTDDGLKADTLTRRITLESGAAKTTLGDKSSAVEIEFKTPFTATVNIAQSLTLELNFPVPVSSACNVRVGRKSSYIEIEAPLFDPLVDNTASLLLYPIFVEVDPCGVTVPTLWASTSIDLNLMPPIDLCEKHEIDFLIIHLSLMFSILERQICESEGVWLDVRTNLKDQLFSLFVRYMGLQGEQAKIFAISTRDGIKMLLIPSCVRLDMLNHTIVLDAAMVPLTKAVKDDGKLIKFFKELPNHLSFGQINVNEADYSAWNAMMPALAERCRTATTYQHVMGCEYAQAGEVPRCEEGESSVCSCGVGKFPEHYLNLKCGTETSSALDCFIRCYATRVAIAPIFAVPFVEECFLKGFTKKDLGEWAILRRSKDNCPRCVIPSGTGPVFVIDYAHCRKCGRNREEVVRAGGKGLLRCSKCKINTYCSIECQRSDWKEHKQICKLNL